MFKYCDANVEYLDEQLKWVGKKEFACSFNFIEQAMKPFEHNMLFLPSINPQTVNINIHLKSDVISLPWGEDEHIEKIESMKYDTIELLDFNASPISHGLVGQMSIIELTSLICKNFCVPQSMLKIITDKTECNDSLYLASGFIKLQDLSK